MVWSHISGDGMDILLNLGLLSLVQHINYELNCSFHPSCFLKRPIFENFIIHWSSLFSLWLSSSTPWLKSTNLWRYVQLDTSIFNFFPTVWFLRCLPWLSDLLFSWQPWNTNSSIAEGGGRFTELYNGFVSPYISSKSNLSSLKRFSISLTVSQRGTIQE